MVLVIVVPGWVGRRACGEPFDPGGEPAAKTLSVYPLTSTFAMTYVGGRQTVRLWRGALYHLTMPRGYNPTVR